MRIESSYKVKRIDPIYRTHNNKQRNSQEDQAPNYQRRNENTTYQEKHTIDFLA